GHLFAPVGKDLLPAALVAAYAKRAAEVVHQDRGFGKGACEIANLVKLRMVDMRLERQAERLQASESASEGLGAHHPGKAVLGAADGSRLSGFDRDYLRVMCRDLADGAYTVRRGKLCGDDRLDKV